jgi:hypothetical protein
LPPATKNSGRSARGIEEGQAEIALILRKGYHPDIDSYSVFYENDRRTATGLAGYLRERGFQRVIVVGILLLTEATMTELPEEPRRRPTEPEMTL